MKPTLIDKPYDSYVAEILKTFENNKPLTADQLNFLIRYEKLLSNYALDSVIKYYLKGYRDKVKNEFTLKEQKLTDQALKHIKQVIQNLLKTNLTHVDLKMSLDQFQHFKAVGINELIFWHGNQFLTGAPFYPGGIPHLIYVQWGNLFGVAKLQLLAGEKAIKGNVLIYFEDLKERNLYQCIHDYDHQMKLEQSIENRFVETKGEDEILIHKPSPTLKPYFYEIH